MHKCSLLLFLVFSLCCAAQQAAPPFPPVKLTPEGRRWADRTMKKMTLDEKIGQMLQVRYYMEFQNFGSDSYKQIREQIQKYHIGSVIMTVRVDGGSIIRTAPLEAAAMTNQLQRDSKVPLLFAADFERGLYSRMSNVPVFPDAMAFGAVGSPADAERFGEITADEARAVGIQWDFFPDTDVNINPVNPIINTRSFGEDPQQVGELAAAYIRGARSHGMLTTAKHFPGHGDTSTDSHLGVARVDADLQRLDAVELPPFKKAIDASVDAVMVAHVSAPALDPAPDHVATISPAVITDLLKKQMGFKGLVVTDALEMRGITSLYPPGELNPAGRAAVDAVKAGNDVVLLPADLDGAYRGLVDAVRRGDIPRRRIDDSVRKILEAKASVGLNRSRFVDLQQVSWKVSRPEDLAFAQQVADNAITLVRDNGQVLPLTRPAPPAPAAGLLQVPSPTPTPVAHPVVVIIISDSIRSGAGRTFELALRARRPDAAVFYVDNNIAGLLSPQILDAVKQAEKIVIAAYVVPVSGKQVMVNGQLANSVSLQQGTGDLVQQVLDAAGPRTALIAMGNPYLALSFPSVSTYICAYSNASSAEVGVVKALFGETQPSGHLPVSLPGIAQRGDGLPWHRPVTAPAAAAPAR